MPAATAPADLCTRFHRLGDLLASHQMLWRAAPFHQPTPDWCRAYPQLADHLLELDDAEVAALANDSAALVRLLTSYFPALAALPGLLVVPQTPGAGEVRPPGRLLAHVPGRKQDQIRAFAAGVGEVTHPVLEWCAGKGHLGRIMAWHCALPVRSLEIDAQLVRAGQSLALRAGLPQTFIQGDALAPASAELLGGHHVLALHACGDLHGVLLREAVARRVPALDVSPCCYYRIASPRYVPFCSDAGLDLSRDELHLAVTETVTAGGRDQRRAAIAMAWKLAFLEWRAESGVGRKVTFPPVPDAWLGMGFDGWMARLCARESLVPPPADRGEALEKTGWERRARVMRHDLVRFAFRRALELWLVLDRAVFLERAGYAVAVKTFCSRETSPRNLLIQARLKPDLDYGH
jgi:hypothetical protein